MGVGSSNPPQQLAAVAAQRAHDVIKFDLTIVEAFHASVPHRIDHLSVRRVVAASFHMTSATGLVTQPWDELWMVEVGDTDQRCETAMTEGREGVPEFRFATVWLMEGLPGAP